MGVTTDHVAIKQQLLWISGVNWAQFGEPNGIWCFGVFWDRGGGFIITSWLTRILFAYDYMPRAAFSQAELDQIDRWFFDAADFWRRDADTGLQNSTGFADRWNENYAFSGACQDPSGGPKELWVGGPLSKHPQRFYNNRRGAIIRFTALAGKYLENVGRNYTNGRLGTLADVIKSGKLFAKEMVRFSVYPVGAQGDFERRSDTLPDLGWAYSSAAIGQTLLIADIYARLGDSSLYEYNTSAGVCGTEGAINDGGSRQRQNRDILFMLQSFMNYHTDQYARYWPMVSQDSRIDGRNPRSGSSWRGNHDVSMAFANVFFKDTFIHQAYTRTHSNSVNYPSSPKGFMQGWQGENSIFPGVLFMFGQMEGKVWPYGAGGTSPTPTPTPTPTPSSSCSNFWNSSLAVPSGFGASFNLFSSAKELLMQAVCGTSSVTYPVGNGSPYMYIYKTGYYWSGSSWSPFNYTGSNSTSDGSWLIGSANYTRNMTQTEMQTKQSFIAYICDWNGTKWNCGCRDTACTVNYWNLQQFKQ